MVPAAEKQADYLGLLNPAQRQAASFGHKAANATFSAGPLLVIAGAGTGKTMTLAHRVAHLIIQGVSPDRILLLTFTRRAAQEMTRRVETIVRQALGGSVCPQVAQGVLPWSGTFHSVGNRLIAESERQYKKNLFSKKQGGGKPSYITVEDGDAEAKYVVEAILANREEGMQLKNPAVLFRGSHHSDRLELELVRRNIPYVKYGGLKFLEAGHVKDLLSVLKWAENPKN